MKTFSVTRTIDATPETVWAILTDGARYHEWDPGLDRLEGRIGPGEKIRVFTKLSPGRTFPVRVTEFVPEQKMTWTGGMPFGLFKGERTFMLYHRAPGRTEFSMREVFSGPLLPILGRSIPDLTPAFEAFASGLKARAERAGA